MYYINILIPLIAGPAMRRKEEKQPYGHGQYPQIKQAIFFSPICLANNLVVH